jgi:hypothetical protein
MVGCVYVYSRTQYTADSDDGRATSHGSLGGSCDHWPTINPME